MKALILLNDADAAVATARTLIDKGFQILCVETLAVAHALIRVDTIDLLVMDERIEGQLTHAIALSSERRNPYLSVILLTNRTAEETDDLYELIPSLYALVGEDTAPDLLGKLALSSVSNTAEVASRVAKNTAMDQAEELAEDEADMLMLDAELTLDPNNDSEGGAPSYADISIAVPALAEIAASERDAALENVEDAIMAEVAALFRNHSLPHLAAMSSLAEARVS